MVDQPSPGGASMFAAARRPSVVFGQAARRRALTTLSALLCVTLVMLAQRAPSAAAASVAPVRHVFVIVLENKEFGETFAAGREFAPYLTQRLPAEGALVPNYFGIGHSSADNYIAARSAKRHTTTTRCSRASRTCFACAASARPTWRARRPSVETSSQRLRNCAAAPRAATS
jgi:hypothetical protein